MRTRLLAALDRAPYALTFDGPQWADHNRMSRLAKEAELNYDLLVALMDANLNDPDLLRVRRVTSRMHTRYLRRMQAAFEMSNKIYGQRAA